MVTDDKQRVHIMGHLSQGPPNGFECFSTVSDVFERNGYSEAVVQPRSLSSILYTWKIKSDISSPSPTGLVLPRGSF